MSIDSLAILRALFKGPQSIVALFNSWSIPGTSMTPLEWGVFAVVVFYGLRIFRRNLLRESGGDES